MDTPDTPTRRRNLSKEKVVTEAMRLADADGLDALSMRRLARAVGVTPMSLYNHVANKDVLLDEMVGEVVSAIQSPQIGGDWRLMMRQRALSMRDVLLQHPWAAIPMISRITQGEATLRDINATVGCLVTAGFSYAQADWARNAIDNHVYGYALQEANYPVAPEDYKSAATAYLPTISETDYPFLHEAARQIAEERYDGKTQFEFGLDLILDGLSDWLDRSRS